MRSNDASIEDLTESLKRSTAALREAGIPFLLGGGLGAWALGGPESLHDLDLMVRPADAERALEALEAVGMRPERPPEGWLYKAWDGPLCIDLIFEPRGMAVDDAVLERGRETEVRSVPVRIMAVEDILVTKLLALEEHSLDYESLLQIARALREQVDWGEVRRRVEASPFARAFFVMLEGLAVIGAGETTASGRANVRVISEAAD